MTQYIDNFCLYCKGVKYSDFHQDTGDIYKLGTPTKCPQSKNGKHAWLVEALCPYCDQEKLFPVDEDGEFLVAQCDACFNVKELK